MLSGVSPFVGHWYHVLLPAISTVGLYNTAFVTTPVNLLHFRQSSPIDVEVSFASNFVVASPISGCSLDTKHICLILRSLSRLVDHRVCNVCHHVKLIARPVVLSRRFLHIVAVQPSLKYVEWAWQLRDEK